jgi:hypothetical protein
MNIVLRSVSLAAILNRQYVNPATWYSAESHAPVADSQTVCSGKLALSRVRFGEIEPVRSKPGQSAASKTELMEKFVVRNPAAVGY